MKAAFALAAAGVAVAQGTYPASCPAPGETGADGRYSCNPAHSYPEGQICQEDGGCYYLRVEGPGVYATPSATVSVDVPEYRTSSAPVYSVDVPEYRTETPSVSVDVPEYRTSSAPIYSVDVPEYRTSTLIVPCPQPTTYVHSDTIVHTASTYIVKTATTLTIPVTYSAPPKAPETHPATTPSSPTTYPVAPPKAPETHPASGPATTPVVYKPTTMAPVPSVPASRNGTQTQSIATYTGAAAQQTAGAILAVAAMGALFL